MKLTGAEILIKCLKEQGVNTVFGFPGGAVLNIYDALYKAQKEIRHILTHMNRGGTCGGRHARNRKDLCLHCHAGAGATNLVTGIATAHGFGADGGDNRPCPSLPRTPSVVDITGITMPITKHNYIVGYKQAGGYSAGGVQDSIRRRGPGLSSSTYARM